MKRAIFVMMALIIVLALVGCKDPIQLQNEKSLEQVNEMVENRDGWQVFSSEEIQSEKQLQSAKNEVEMINGQLEIEEDDNFRNVLKERQELLIKLIEEYTQQ